MVHAASSLLSRSCTMLSMGLDAPVLGKHCAGTGKAMDGKIQGPRTGRENYEMSEDVWEIIGQEGVDAVRQIPSTFVRSLPNIYTA